jgi:hypothetical protein
LHSGLGAVSHDLMVETGYYWAQIVLLVLSIGSGLGSTILTWMNTNSQMANMCRNGQTFANIVFQPQYCDEIEKGLHSPGTTFKILTVIPLIIYWAVSVCTSLNFLLFFF